MRKVSILLALAASCGQSPKAGEASLDLPNVGQVKLSGPYVHKNLAIYLVHRTSGQEPEVEYLTLEEAMASGAVRLTEKEGVETLEIENTSDKPVFVQGGDVVKGGKQDRTIYHTFVLPPRSGKVDAKALCVEQGRWSGGAGFDGSAGQLYSKESKLAAREENSQQKVWDEVAKAKQALSENAGTGRSQTDSVNEEYEKAAAKIAEFERALAEVIERHPDAIGLAYGVNGNVDGVQVYASHSLFLKMHRKVLRSCGAEAIAKYDPKGGEAAQPQTCVAALLKAANNPDRGRDTALPGHNNENARSSKEDAYFELQWGGKTVHVEMIKK